MFGLIKFLVWVFYSCLGWGILSWSTSLESCIIQPFQGWFGLTSITVAYLLWCCNSAIQFQCHSEFPSRHCLWSGTAEKKESNYLRLLANLESMKTEEDEKRDFRIYVLRRSDNFQGVYQNGQKICLHLQSSVPKAWSTFSHHGCSWRAFCLSSIQEVCHHPLHPLGRSCVIPLSSAEQLQSITICINKTKFTILHNLNNPKPNGIYVPKRVIWFWF